MKRVIRMAEKAERDLFLCSGYIARENQDAAIRFLEAFEETKEYLFRMPKIGREKNFGNAELTGLREFPIADFGKYLVFYHEDEDSITIIRVLHGARDLPTIFSDGKEK